MSLPENPPPTPIEVRLAGLFTGLPGLGLLVLGVVILVEGLGTPPRPGNNIWAEFSTYAVLALAFLAASIGLLLGRTWARSPGVVVALLLIGVGWYILGPSGQPLWGAPIGLFGIAALVLLFRRPARAWALGMREDETEEEAAERGGLAGRRAEREGRERK
ncbi:membrane protein [Amycolatopsis ultiminotia]|uniref:Membrane protein n=1 Tax=Amycolatopsis ultiminotia TaxID=543629 RepID=A0ABP6XUT2_9PSEU